MIVRVILLKLRNRAARDEVAEMAEDLRAAPGVLAVRTGQPADAGAEVWDLLVEVTFPDLAAASAFPTTAAWHTFDGRAGPSIEVQKAWNFAVAPSPLQ